MMMRVMRPHKSQTAVDSELQNSSCEVGRDDRPLLSVHVAI